MRLQAECFRAHDPRWSFSPTSGDGAKLNGGRFNPNGVAALYLSRSERTCILEAKQGLAARMRPLTICSYDIDVREIADLTDAGVRDDLSVQLADLACPWIVDRAVDRRPASWRIADRLRRDWAGILVRSLAHGATSDDVNVVLWRWNDDPSRTVRVYDPDGQLPRDQSSWSP